MSAIAIFVGDALSAEESEELLALGLWQFETLVSIDLGRPPCLTTR